MAEMRVGLLIYGSLETISGGYLYDRMLVKHLRRQGDHVEIISLPWRNYARHLLDNFSRSLLNKCLNLQVDVLIQDELNHPSLAWLNSKLHAPYPIIALVHHLRANEQRPGWQNAVYRQVEHRYLDSVDGFIFNSQTTKHSVARISPIAQRPAVIATPAGDRFSPEIAATEITARAQQPGPLRLIFLGNLIPRKGLHTLVESISQLEPGCCTLDVVGGLDADSNYAQRIFQKVKRAGLAASIRFHGAQSDNALENLFRNSQVLVVPSSYEGFGIVYLEGMGFGLPAIGTTQGAASEIIIHGETGFLIKPDDAAGLAVLLRNLCQDRNLLAALGMAARQRYQQFPLWEQSMVKIRSFLLNLTGK
jgi:glycosyltransferase involved in cell wall biosynthesis